MPTDDWGTKYDSRLNTKDQYKYLHETYPGYGEDKEPEQQEFIKSGEVRDAMDTLPDNIRKVLILYYFQDTPIADIAVVLGESEGTVKSRLSRARNMLQEVLGNGL